jgi:hypothetical protein
LAAGLTGLTDLLAAGGAGFFFAALGLDFTGAVLATGLAAGFDPFDTGLTTALTAGLLLATTALALALEDTGTFPGLAFTICLLAKKLAANTAILYPRMAAPCGAATGFLLARECTAF